MQKRIYCFFILALSACVIFPSLCFSHNETENYRMINVLSNGCTVMTSENFFNNLIIGQRTALSNHIPVQTLSYENYPGFWYTTFCSLSVFAASYGSLSGDLHYNSECDMDKDGDIDGTDLYRFINQP